MKSTQLAYPTAQFFEGGTTSRTPDPEKPSLENLPKLKLVASRKPEGRQIHHMRDGCVVLYKRDRSDVWQVRFKLFDMKWHCYSTKHKDLEYARRVASTLYDRSRFAEEMGMPLVAKTL